MQRRGGARESLTPGAHHPQTQDRPPPGAADSFSGPGLWREAGKHRGGGDNLALGTQHACVLHSSANVRGILLARQSRCCWALRGRLGCGDHPKPVPAPVLGDEVVGRASVMAVKCRCPGATAYGARWAMLAPARPSFAGVTPSHPCPDAGTVPWGCSTSSGPGASHRALGRPLRSRFNEAPCLIGTGRPVFIKQALAGGGFRGGPGLRILNSRPDPEGWDRQGENCGHGKLRNLTARFGDQGWGLRRGRLMKGRGCAACCAFKKSEGIATPPLPENSLCLGKLPAADPGAFSLSGRCPCPGLPAVRWPWALEILTIASLAAHKEMPLDLSIARPGTRGEPLGQWPGGHRYVGCWGQGNAG